MTKKSRNRRKASRIIKKIIAKNYGIWFNEVYKGPYRDPDKVLLLNLKQKEEIKNII